jgi:predicted GIY-YIG superfamily endonuclease
MQILPEIDSPEPARGAFWVYILQSADGTFYVGQTTNVPERVRKHRYGLGSKHTREHLAFRLIFVQHFPSLIEAVQREKQLKQGTRAKNEALASGQIMQLKALSRSCT